MRRNNPFGTLMPTLPQTPISNPQTPMYNPMYGYTNINFGGQQGGSADAQQQCAAQGGTWDYATNTCRLPQQDDNDPIAFGSDVPDNVRWNNMFQHGGFENFEDTAAGQVLGMVPGAGAMSKLAGFLHPNNVSQGSDVARQVMTTGRYPDGTPATPEDMDLAASYINQVSEFGGDDPLQGGGPLGIGGQFASDNMTTGVPLYEQQRSLESMMPPGAQGATNTGGLPTGEPSNILPTFSDGLGFIKDALGQAESNNDYTAENDLGYVGKYQFGDMALQDTGYKDANGNWTGKNGVYSKDDFKRNAEAQEEAQDTLMSQNTKQLSNIIENFDELPPETQAGLVAAAHLGGATRAGNWYKGGMKGGWSDGYGTTLNTYFNKGVNSAKVAQRARDAAAEKRKKQIEAAEAQAAAKRAAAAAARRDDDRGSSRDWHREIQDRIKKEGGTATKQTSSGSYYSGGNRNKGGMVHALMAKRGYNTGGPAETHPYDREGEEHDTIPAMLTEGEFVIDADSTHAIQKKAPELLEVLNAWEPEDGEEALAQILHKVASAMEERPQEEQMVQSMTTPMQPPVAAPQVPQSGAPMQLNAGGMAGIANWLMQRRQDPQQRNLAAARQAKQSGALMNAGAQMLGRGADNRTNLMGSVGLKTNQLGRFGQGGYQPGSFSQKPMAATNFGSQMQAMGQGQQEVANAEQTYRQGMNQFIQDKVNRERQLEDQASSREHEVAREQAKLDAAAEKRDEKESKANEKLVSTLKTSRQKIIESIGLVDKAASYISKYNNIERNAFSELSKEEQAAYLAALAIGSGTEAERLLSRRTQQKLYDLKGQDKEGARAMATLNSNVNKLTLINLDLLGPGPKTDFDFKVLASTFGDVSSEPWEMKAQLEQALRDLDAELAAQGVETEKYTPASAPAAETAPTPASFSTSAQYNNPHDTSTPSLTDRASDMFDQVTDGIGWSILGE